MERENLKKVDKEIYDILLKEQKRQEEKIELIASENFVSDAVLEVVGSEFTNKYAEGYPNKRYYSGCEYIDQMEKIGIERAKKLFNVEHVNMQPHSGASANIAVYLALLNIGDTILGMNLSEGGHLTHGSKVNISGKLYNFVHYGLGEDERIDYEKVRKLALKHKPKMIVCGASAYTREFDFKKFREIADEVGAYLMADISHISGLVIAGLHMSPAEYCDIITTTTHKTLRGPRGGIIMCKKEFAKKIDKSVFPGLQGGPLEHVIAGKAVAFKEALAPEFKEYQKQILKNIKAMEKVFNKEDIYMISGGTDTHMLLLRVIDLGITGREAADRLEKINIIVNKNSIKNEKLSMTETSGIRLGTPAITTKGFKEDDAKKVAEIIVRALKYNEAEKVLKKEVKDLLKKVKER